MLYRFTGKVGDVVNRTIDESFYKDIDDFVVAIREMSITNYTTKNRIGATETIQIPQSYQTFEMDKKEVSLEDLFNGDNFYGKQMQLEYEAWKEMNVDTD